MPPTAQVGVRWQRETGKYWVEVVSDMADKADKLSADDKRDTQRIPPDGTPGYAVFHVRTGTRSRRTSTCRWPWRTSSTRTTEFMGPA